MKTSEKTTLASLGKRELATIVAMDEAKLPLKIFELGCLVGSQVEILQKAPFQDPILVQVNDSLITIRKEMAQLIEVARLSQDI